MVERRRLVPVIDRVLPLAEAAAGIRMLANRDVIGKIIVAP
jgi:NADPH:quinone reductase-like Zn-dependent oxidoreductase